jgi:hypothetical protein
MSETHGDRMRRLETESAARKQRLRAEADAEIARSQRHRDELLEQNRRHKELLREESMERRRQRDRVELASRRGHRDFAKALGVSLTPVERQQWIDEMKEETADPSDPIAKKLETWLQDICSRERIDVRFCAAPEIANGTAARTSRYIEVAQGRSVMHKLIAAHEVGHVLHPPVADERAIPGEFGIGKISVPCEIAAWRWVLDHIPVWTAAMHLDMTRFLGSYRGSAIESELHEIDDLCSPLTMRETQLRILKSR